MEVGNPHPTIYLQNLNEKVKPVALKSFLQEFLLPVGPIVNIVAKRSLSLRGQAWVQFDSTEAARKAIDFLQGRRLYGKTVVVKFAKFKSDSVSREDGTYDVEKYHREQEKLEKARNPRLTRRQMMQQMMSNPAMLAMSGTMPSAGPMPVGVGSDLQLPNKILFIQAIPAGVTEEVLGKLFIKYPGFSEVRPVPGRPDLAFVEFDTEMQATVSKNAMDRYEVAPGAPLRVTFARR